MSGYINLWRKLFASEVWKMPPVYLRVWLWILGNVQWRLYEASTPTRYSIYILPGQKITSLTEIAKGVSWDEWGTEKVPNRKTISKVLEWLESRGQINTESNSKHTFISVVNWDTYQNEQEEKVTEKVTRRGRPNTHASDTNNKENKDNKEKNKPLDSANALSSPRPQEKVPLRQIVALYHELCPMLPTTEMPESLKRQIRARYKNGMANIGAWRTLFSTVAASDFLTGRTGNSWTPNLFWITNPNNMDKILGGAYGNKRKASNFELAFGQTASSFLDRHEGE